MAKLQKTLDGNTAAAYAAYAFTEIASIYPITPSSTMAEVTEEWAAHGQKNMFGHAVRVTELQSEGGAAGAMHGVLSAGTLATTYTASQGLLLMIPSMYKIAGEALPGVFHVSARSLATHALNIFGDHSDVMAVRQTGVAMLATGSVQEVADLAPVAHLAAIAGSLPFCHFFDGFRTSHEVQKVELLDYPTLAGLVDRDALQAFRDHALNSEHPYTKGTAQNPDVFFQVREAGNGRYQRLPAIVQGYMDRLAEHTGRSYHLFDYDGSPDATDVVVAMGSVTETLSEVVDFLRAEGRKVGVLKVRLFRPFSTEAFLSAFPDTVERIAVLDRTKEPGAHGEPLYLDVVEAFSHARRRPLVIGGRYGLGSKDTTPSQILAVFDNLAAAEPRTPFTLGISDDVTGLSLTPARTIVTEKSGATRCKFWGLGSDGTVGANKNAIKIIGDHSDLFVQAYFAYDSKKSGGVTVSHLRFGSEPIRSTYLISEADFIACHNQAYVQKYDLLAGIKPGGIFLLNCNWDDAALERELPAAMRRTLAERDIRFYTIDASVIAREIGLAGRINMVTQAAFFRLVEILPLEKVMGYLEEGVRRSYGKKGERVVKMNIEAAHRGVDAVHRVHVPPHWADARDDAPASVELPDFVRTIMQPINRLEGDALPVSAFLALSDGVQPGGSAAYEKRGIAADVPVWLADNCTQCNVCSFVCPHAAIRPFLLDETEMAGSDGFDTLKTIGRTLHDFRYRIQVSPLDCTGCNNCVDACPGKRGESALVMRPIADSLPLEAARWEYVMHQVRDKPQACNNDSAKGTQFAPPLFEFSGACAGCGETPIVRQITQMFGPRMIVANATGCSSIFGGSFPSSPYTSNRDGRGPAWANSLFEDNAEFGFGIGMAYQQGRSELKAAAAAALDGGVDGALGQALKQWLEQADDAEASLALSQEIKRHLPAVSDNPWLERIHAKRDFLEKKSVWMFGGDGWAYDIGYGGLDHVLASNEDVNILVMDTEIYSNTGGQASKSTPTAAIAKFASSGKHGGKKNLGLIAMTYGHVYVAQVALGDRNQMVQALQEAESYPGPSLVIAFAPCISHGIRGGMTRSPSISADAINSGYWNLFRFDPRLREQGLAPFQLDSEAPSTSFRNFIENQVRFSALRQVDGEHADALFDQLEKQSRDRFQLYQKLAETQPF
ncbi:pyruvate:ferredoxin (flavodoxin) oxidoreductase [Paludibacterium yongneupense]|uniref:pyruvate:ferredoxin (flavodoxin) oxidoreductase n=1 Tax=Paludibacterium yongneupense TaxID=400061 RepID=UPI00040CA900|nr:pyruvate:ferredoxin (flavodoxin) oxidoreductase [Paludibacterium yongneupense]